MKGRTHFTRRLAACAAAASMALVQSPAHSWDGAVVGTIASLDVTGGSNYGLRIGLNDISSMCNGGENWAFLNDTDSNYKAYVAALLLAKAQGSRVAVYTMLEGSYCHIGYISILAVVSQ